MPARRRVLGGLAAAALAPRLGWAALGAPLWLAAAKARDGSHRICGLDSAGAVAFALPLPARGHAAAAHPQRPEAVAFARRPGTFGLVIDCQTGALIRRLTPPQGRQFNGHGAFSADGSLLLTSEVVAEGSAGRVGLWDADAGYERLGEWESHGIGPHELLMTPEGQVLVANGGIQTDPTDRSKLNLETMAPNLALLSADGALISQRSLPPRLSKNSIRHLALTPRGAALALQWQGAPSDPVPLLALAEGASSLRAVALPEPEALLMRGYAGSVAASGGMIALTSPRGGVAMLFDARGTHLASLRRADLCGAAPHPGGGFALTDGGGAIWRADPHGLQLLAKHDLAWDNHLVPIG